MSTPNTLEKLNESAKSYCAEDLASALTYGTRLSKILSSIQNNIALSQTELLYLNNQGLLALYKLALNEINIGEFFSLAKMEQEARVNQPNRKGNNLVHLELIAKYHQKQQYIQQKEAERIILKQKNEVARIALKSKEKEIARTTRKSQENAQTYLVEDLPSALLHGTQLSNILNSRQNKIALSDDELHYLIEQGFTALYQLATDKITFENFTYLAKLEQVARINQVKEEKEKQERILIEKKKEIARIAIDLEKQKEADRIARESDPIYILEKENQILRKKYDINDTDVNQYDCSYLMQILNDIDKNIRLNEQDFLWLKTRKRFFTEKLRLKYHSLEACYYQQEYIKTNNIWMAINASSHYRKAKKAELGKKLLVGIDIKNQKKNKIKSAFHTTFGGVHRDLTEFTSALECGESAHKLTPNDFRPCTLLGAVNIELGNYALGFSWYEKAKERGAEDQSIDEDIKTIFMRADKDRKQNIINYLAEYDADLCQKLKALLEK